MARRFSGCRQTSGRVATAALALAVLLHPSMVRAQTSRLPPMIDAMTAPFTESELGAIGCLTATAVAGGTVLAIAGGPAVATALQAPLPPLIVLEGGAALAFLLSSACYVGQALTPAAIMGWTSITDRFASPKVEK